MAGIHHPLGRSHPLDFSGVAAGGSNEIVLARELMATEFREWTLLVRVHSTNIAGSGTISVIARSEAPSLLEPRVDFVSSDQVTITIDSSATAPLLLLSALPPNQGPFFRIVARGVQGPTQSALRAIVSLGLVGRS